MRILAHRGLWKTAEERNLSAALHRAIDAGFGVETDIRDMDGRLVISHDPAGNESYSLSDFLAYYKAAGSEACLALNVKADGIWDMLAGAIEAYEIENYFVFDMSVPEEVMYMKKGIPFFTRQSDIERHCVLYDEACGIWADSFFDERWLNAGLIKEHVKAGKRVAVISSEIHGRDNGPQWELLSGLEEGIARDVMLCTDEPQKAEGYFHGKN